ncbi:MAG: hypothetical protein R2856_11395 [Caldilineaceae bacterium]
MTSLLAWWSPPVDEGRRKRSRFTTTVSGRATSASWLWEAQAGLPTWQCGQVGEVSDMNETPQWV